MLKTKNHQFRKINELIDFSFIRDELKDLLIEKTVQIAMTPERIITAATVTSGEKPDGKGRYKIAAKNSELKNVLGYDVSMGNCLYATKIQGACTIFAANIKRIITILDEK